MALSSTEAEYVCASIASQEIIWLLELLNDLELHQQTPITLYEDNLSAIKLTENEKAQTKIKHINVKYHHIRHLSEKGTIKLVYCPTERMLADILTKALPKAHLEYMSEKLQVKQTLIRHKRRSVKSDITLYICFVPELSVQLFVCEICMNRILTLV